MNEKENEKCAILLCGPSIKLFIQYMYKNRSSLICMSVACDCRGGGGTGYGVHKVQWGSQSNQVNTQKGEPVQKFHSLLGSFDDI